MSVREKPYHLMSSSMSGAWMTLGTSTVPVELWRSRWNFWRMCCSASVCSRGGGDLTGGSGLNAGNSGCCGGTCTGVVGGCDCGGPPGGTVPAGGGAVSPMAASSSPPSESLLSPELSVAGTTIVQCARPYVGCCCLSAGAPAAAWGSRWPPSVPPAVVASAGATGGLSPLLPSAP